MLYIQSDNGGDSLEKKIRILIIEDVPSDAEMAEHEIRKAGIKFVAKRVETKPDYLTALKEFNPHLILSDYSLPTFDGMSALRLARELAPNTPFILTTGSLNEETAVACMKAGATDYILKERIARLGPAIEAALEKQRIKEEKEEAEAKLRESMVLYKTLFESANDAILLLQGDRFIDCNPRTLTMFACERDGILRKRPWDFSPMRQPDGSRSAKKASEKSEAALRGEPQFFEWKHQRLDGTEFDAEVSLAKVEMGGQSFIQAIIRDVTERKRTQEAIRESEQRYREVVENAADIIFTIDTEGKFTFANSAGLKSIGYTLEDLCQHDYLQLVLPEHRTRLGKFYRHQLLSKQPTTYVEFPFLTKDGDVKWFGQNATLVFEGKKVTGFHVIARDITERKRSEEALRESELRFQSLAEAAPVGIFRTNASGSTTYVNRRWCEISQMGSDEALGDGWLKVVHPDDLATLDATWLQASSARAPSQVEYRFLHRDGTTAWVVGHAVPQQNARGEFDGYIGTITDITERKRTEVKLQQLSTAVEQSPASIVITDVKGNIEYVNPRFEQVTGYTLAEVIGKNPNILKAGEKTKEEYAQLWKTILSGNVWHGEFHNVKKNGELYWELASISPIIDANGTTTHFLAVKEDITQQKLYEETFRQTQKMQSIGTLAGGIAHDFNNILGIIIGHSGLLRENDNSPDKFSRSLSAIDTAAQRGASLVRQILTFARKSEIRFELVRINDIIKELAKLIEETFPKSITFLFHLERQLPLIDGDASQLHQTMLNLCVNARDAMPHGGTISIATETVVGEAVQKHFPHATMDEYAQVTVHDNGTGMSEEVRKRIFEPFYTTKELGKGTGLGLSVVYGIVNDHHGFIDVESEPGEGTTFRMYFPVPGNRLDQIAKKEEQQAVARGKNETILVVEDEELLRDAIKNILTSNGYRVLTAIDGVEAIEIFKNESGPIALVLMDFGLPKLSGLDALREMKRINPTVKCIVSSGYLDPEIREEILGLDITNVLPKPYLEGDILSLVRNVLDSDEKTGPKD